MLSGGSFGSYFLKPRIKDKPHPAKCDAYCPKDTHLMVINYKSYIRIKERIAK